MTESMMAEKSVNISQLPLPQLDRIKNQLDEELSFLTSSMEQLKAVQGKLRDSQKSLEVISPENEGTTTLVPLTSSMYVSGKLKNMDKVLVDIGTGYFVEKPTKEAVDFYQRKLDYLSENIEKLQRALMEKHRMREAVVSTMQLKVQTQMLQQVQRPQ